MMTKQALFPRQFTITKPMVFAGVTPYDVDTILQVNTKLSDKDSLSPSSEVNACLSTLVHIVSHRHPQELQVLFDPRIKKITQSTRSLSARAESEMEHYWAKKILGSYGKKHAWYIMKKFWYYKNYQKLTVFEYDLLQKNGYCFTSSKKTLFIGGGPLPLTAIMMWKLYGIQSIVIDSDKDAVEESRSVLKKLGLAEMIEVQHACGSSYQEYKDIGVVFVASLAGLSEKEKSNILHSIGKNITDDTYVVVRSATGLRQLLYPPVCMENITALRVVDHQDPAGEIINCAYICKKK